MPKIPVWPNRLPPPDIEYSYTVQSAFLRTELTSGRARQRRIYRNVPTQVQVQWKIPWADMPDFRYFVHEIVGNQNGWGFFEALLAFDEHKKKMRARFMDANSPYDVSNESNVLWIVSAKLEVLELDLISSDAFFQRNPEFR